MKITIALLFVCLALLVNARSEEQKIPAEAAEALATADQGILYAVRARSLSDSKEASLQGWKIVGQVKIDREQIREVGASISAAVAAPGEKGKRCFNPHRALRVISHGITYDFLLCYDCEWVRIFSGEQHLASLGLKGSPEVVDRLLANGGIVPH